MNSREMPATLQLRRSPAVPHMYADFEGDLEEDGGTWYIQISELDDLRYRLFRITMLHLESNETGLCITCKTLWPCRTAKIISEDLE